MLTIYTCTQEYACNKCAYAKTVLQSKFVRKSSNAKPDSRSKYKRKENNEAGALMVGPFELRV